MSLIKLKGITFLLQDSSAAAAIISSVDIQLIPDSPRVLQND
jgi:hypothetical protein